MEDYASQEVAVALHISANRRLTSLNFASHRFGVQGLEFIVDASFGSLASVAFQGCNLKDAGVLLIMDHINALPACSLTSLDLRNNRITASGAASLATLLCCNHCRLLKLELKDKQYWLRGRDRFDGGNRIRQLSVADSRAKLYRF